MLMYGAQNHLNPPLPAPYPYADTYDHLQVKISFKEENSTILLLSK